MKCHRSNVANILKALLLAVLSDQMHTAPTQQELSSLSAACQRIWQLDINRIQPGQDYILNPQHGKKSYMEQDVAPGPLFAQLNRAVFQPRSTYALLLALLDNYHAQVGQAEHLTAAQNLEVQRFLDEVVQTQCMQYVQQILVAQVGHQSTSNRYSRCSAAVLRPFSPMVLPLPSPRLCSSTFP